ncbi:MAG: PepSY-like domain-containing protein [Bacteroidetes bacterium]|nr:PepSY-like domain-containing protein [Bacteroidota bacterium]
MKRLLVWSMLPFCLIATNAMAQKVKNADVPATVKNALEKKYPDAKDVTWEKEKGNYEANWGGKSKEDNSVIFTPDGSFVEMVVAIPVSSLPPAVATYVKAHYPGSKITEAGKVTDAKGATSYEAEVKGKDLVFDEKGNFVKID